MLFQNCTVFGTVVTFLTVLLDISVTLFGMGFQRKNGKFLISEKSLIRDHWTRHHRIIAAD